MWYSFVCMDIFSAIFLGVVQGATEFLPISSSGHLILMRAFLGLDMSQSLAFDAVLQLATTLAVILYFWKDLWTLLSVRNKKNNTIFGAIVIATIPAVVVGFLFENKIDALFRNAHSVAWALIAGSVLFIFAEWYAKKHFLSGESGAGVKNITGENINKSENINLEKYLNLDNAEQTEKSKISLVKGLWIGLFQTLAFIPGMSRSGVTISGGLFLTLPRALAVRFSFLLSIPILLGSGLKKLLDLGGSGSIDASLIVGSLFAFFVGLASIHFLILFLRKHTLNAFVVYRILLAVMIFWFL